MEADVSKDLSSWTVCKPGSREHMFSGQQPDQIHRLTQIDSARNTIMFTGKSLLTDRHIINSTIVCCQGGFMLYVYVLWDLLWANVLMWFWFSEIVKDHVRKHVQLTYTLYSISTWGCHVSNVLGLISLILCHFFKKKCQTFAGSSFSDVMIFI